MILEMDALISAAVFGALWFMTQLDGFGDFPAVRAIQRICGWIFVISAVLFASAFGSGVLTFVEWSTERMMDEVGPILDDMTRPPDSGMPVPTTDE